MRFGLNKFIDSYFVKIIGFNRYVPWSVLFTYKITSLNDIFKNNKASLSSIICNNIKAPNGIKIANNVLMAPNVVLISANQYPIDYNKHLLVSRISIRSNVCIWAGSLFIKDTPCDVITSRNLCKLLKAKQPNICKTYE